MPRVPATVENIRIAAEALREGGLVSFPTETVYGLGADAASPTACARVFDVKKRPHFDPLIVHVLDRQSARELVTSWDDRAALLAERYWPGPLTLVLFKRALVPDIVTAGLPTVAVRVPSHPVARALLEASECPIAAPSANPFGYLSPTTAEHVEAGLGSAVPWILDAGPCPGGIESTIVDVSGQRPALLRTGGVSAGEIESLIGPLCRPEGGEVPLAPGQLPSHYAPRVPLVLLNGRAVPPESSGRFGLLAFEEPPASVSVAFRAVEVLSPSGSVVEAAARLFSCLHRLDALDVEAIHVEPVPESGAGAAVMDRLRRGAARRVPPVRPED